MIVVVRFDSFKKKPKAGYTIILEGRANFNGTSSKIILELSGSCMINLIYGYMPEEIIPYLKEDFEDILDYITPRNIKSKVALAQKECESFSYIIYRNSETDDVVVKRRE